MILPRFTSSPDAAARDTVRNWRTSRGCRARVGLCAALVSACAAAPLPAENPEEQPKERAQVVPILVNPPAEKADAEVATIAGIGLATPESVVVDATHDSYLVSNVNGAPTAIDDNGFISKLTPDGRLIDFQFIAGGRDGVVLNAPKGMVVVDTTLYVADVSAVRLFDVVTGAPRGSVDIDGATFLNDVAAAPDGSVYVSDSGLKASAAGLEASGSDAIYRIDAQRQAHLLAHGSELGHPNGLSADADGVWVVGWGSGELSYVDTSGKRSKVQKLPTGQLDGLVHLADGSFLISSWEGSCVYRGKSSEAFTPVISGVASPADIAYDAARSRLVVPLFTKDAVEIFSLLGR